MTNYVNDDDKAFADTLAMHIKNKHLLVVQAYYNQYRVFIPSVYKKVARSKRL